MGPGTTGIGILCLHLLDGATRPEAVAATHSLVDKPTDDTSPYPFYGMYYATQAAFQAGEGTWAAVSKITLAKVIKLQQPDGGWPEGGAEAAARDALTQPPSLYSPSPFPIAFCPSINARAFFNWVARIETPGHPEVLRRILPISKNNVDPSEYLRMTVAGATLHPPEKCSRPDNCFFLCYDATMLCASQGFHVKPSFWTGLVIILSSLFPLAGQAQYILEDVHDPHRYDPGQLIVPIGYYSSGFAATGGLAGYTDGLGQRQLDTFLFLVGSTNGSYGLIGGMNNLQLRPIDRLFMDWQLSYVRTQQDENNTGRNPAFPNQNAGSNDSSQFNLIAGPSNDSVGSFTFRYLLPIGDGRERIIDHYRLEGGLVEAGASGGEGWNPLQSGRTFLRVTPFYEYLTLASHDNPHEEHNTDGLAFSAVYDNRDFPLSPERGNVTTLTLSRDMGLFDTSSTWTNLSAEYAQYISLGRSGLFRQQVLALNAWTSYSTTWRQSGDAGNLNLSGCPPSMTAHIWAAWKKCEAFPKNASTTELESTAVPSCASFPTGIPSTAFPSLKVPTSPGYSW